MGGKVVRIKSFEKYRTEVISGHLKDAWLHVMAETPLPGGIRYTPTDEIFKRLVEYLENSGALDDGFEQPYLILLSAANRALDVKDPTDMKLRDVEFQSLNGHCAHIQRFLMDGIRKADHHHKPEETHG